MKEKGYLMRKKRNYIIPRQIPRIIIFSFVAITDFTTKIYNLKNKAGDCTLI